MGSELFKSEDNGMGWAKKLIIFSAIAGVIIILAARDKLLITGGLGDWPLVQWLLAVNLLSLVVGSLALARQWLEKKTEFSLHKPLVGAVAAAIIPYLAYLFYQAQYTRQQLFVVSIASFLWFCGGVLYDNVFEYLWHRVFFHVGVPGLGFIKRSHADHHRHFCDDHFARRDLEALNHIATRWYVFPILYFLHFALFWKLFPGYLVYAQAFFLGILLRFLLYEITHWFTHVKDNGFDRMIGRLEGTPLLGLVAKFRKKQIERHHHHHDLVKVEFSFAPFYLPPYYEK